MEMTEVRHKWLDESVPDALFDFDNQILCKKMGTSSALPVFYLGVPGYIVTVEDAKVSCQQCLEWLHA